MLKLYDSPVSPCCMKVRLCLAEKDLNYEPVPVNLGAKANLEPDYLALNAKGVVPTLVDGDIPIVESTLINEYLDDKFPDPPLKPAAPEARVAMRLWTKFVDEELHPANGAVIWPILSLTGLRKRDPDEVRAMLSRHPDPKRVARQLAIFDQGFGAAVVGEGVKVFVSAVNKLETALDTDEYLAGNTFSLADIALLPYVNEVMRFGIDALAEDKPNLHAWFERVTARPSYRTAIGGVLPAEQWENIQARGRAAWEEIGAHLQPAAAQTSA
ncbi:MAG: glutathione S-transferase family protein [Gammaproteobacteria bacterium]|nr:glutathione S-transferase family protein [Gammaproteobacteria bacterium]